MNAIIAWLLPVLINLLISYGVPALAAKFPKLAPLLEQLLKALHPSVTADNQVPDALHQASDRYKECSGPLCSFQLVKE